MKKNILKITLFFLLPLLTLTACTGKQDIAFELEEQGKAQETEYVPDVETTVDDGNAAAEEVIIIKEPAVIYVHICGAVVNPGVYALDAGSRVFEGIEAAGGFSEEACEDYVNQAEELRDGQRLIIPTLEEVDAVKDNGSNQESWRIDALEAEQSAVGEAVPTGNADGLININTADESELSSIDGIGAGKAAAIVKYRQENGNFQTIQDIMKVSGIKEGTYEKIKDKITVK
ncbi:MAG: helix-hairpin-helix domain-containing protein [Lachnospiraceae bacterium]|nr:helix-hairpin-helix domain-containing protein [Lachnospiraceae bacterium]